MITVRLMGNPTLERDGAAATLKGRKSWGLLAYLIEAAIPHTREHLAGLLFADADDPLRALRWNLSELRRAVGATIGGDPMSITFSEETIVDVDVLRDRPWQEAVRLPGLGHDLLEGFHFDSSPVFETWLLTRRRQARAASEAVLREGALSALAAGEHDIGIDLAARLVALDPLHEESQALLIRSYMVAGDRIAAARQAEACTQLLQRQLGVDPGAEVTSALSVAPASATTAAVGGLAAAQAQLEAGRAAVRAGAYEAGIECLRRATSEAHACGDTRLKSHTLFELGSTLVHSGRNLRTEGSAALHEALALAITNSQSDVETRSCYELAWVDFLDARYDRARLWLDRAEAKPLSDQLSAGVMWVRGKLEMEVGNYAASIDFLTRAVDAAERAGDVFRHGFALASLGRSHLMRGDLGHATQALERSLAVVREGAPGLVPLAEGFLAQVRLWEGNVDAAHDLAAHAYAYALEVGDVSMIGIAARPLSLSDAKLGRTDTAIARLREVRQRFISSPDHTWTFVYVLDALCQIAIDTESEDAPNYVAEMSDVVAKGAMTEMLVRALLHRARLGERGAAHAAAAMAAGIDNAAVLDLVETASLG